jgi:CheY-like chemotaxis protein
VVTRQLVSLMGGQVGAHSVVGEGSVFWVTLKRAQNAVPQIHPDDGLLTPSADQTAIASAAAKRTVLYVEDNPANLVLVEHLLARRSDLRLLTAVNARLGIELAQAHLPDVILMDINLPGMNGYAALDVLRRTDSTAHIPVLALSANAVPHDIEKGMAAGFLRYLTKPIRVVEFMAALDIALLCSMPQTELP